MNQDYILPQQQYLHPNTIYNSSPCHNTVSNDCKGHSNPGYVVTTQHTVGVNQGYIIPQQQYMPANTIHNSSPYPDMYQSPPIQYTVPTHSSITTVGQPPQYIH